jgi:hypothetical protein
LAPPARIKLFLTQRALAVAPARCGATWTQVVRQVCTRTAHAVAELACFRLLWRVHAYKARSKTRRLHNALTWRLVCEYAWLQSGQQTNTVPGACNDAVAVTQLRCAGASSGHSAAPAASLTTTPDPEQDIQLPDLRRCASSELSVSKLHARSQDCQEQSKDTLVRNTYLDSSVLPISNDSDQQCSPHLSVSLNTSGEAGAQAEAAPNAMRALAPPQGGQSIASTDIDARDDSEVCICCEPS